MVGNGYESSIPGFAGMLDKADVEAIFDCLKSAWPKRERTHQERVIAADEAAGGQGQRAGASALSAAKPAQL